MSTNLLRIRYNNSIIILCVEPPEGSCFFNVHLLIKIFNSDGLVQDCSNSIANALELLQSCAKPLI